MADTMLIFSCVLILSVAAMQGTHAVDYPINDNSGNSAGGVIFKNQIGEANARQTMVSASEFIWNIFQQSNPADRKSFSQVTLFIENGVGVASTRDNKISVYADYLGGFQGDVKREFEGIMYHEMTHVWQWDGNHQTPGWLIEGIADFVRLKANYIANNWVQPGQGNNWEERSDVTARFLEYCDSVRSGFVAELNKKMRSGYSDGYFVELLMKPVDQLWSDYKANYGN